MVSAYRRGLPLLNILILQLISIYKAQLIHENPKNASQSKSLPMNSASFSCDENNPLAEMVTNPCMCGFLRDQEEVDISDAPVTGSVVQCIGGFSNTGHVSYPCSNIELMSYLPLSTLNAAWGILTGKANDCWGWTDKINDREYAIVTMDFGTVFVDITDPINPIYIGKLRSRGRSSWGDVKTYMDHAFMVKETMEGLQVIDLRTLGSYHPGSVLTETAHYDGFTNAHNLAINEESGFAYAVGTQTCSGGLHMIDIRNPSMPTFAGCYGDDGYTHDVQCVNYKGSHSEYIGKEVCFAFNEDTVTIVDVSDKSNPYLLSRTSYPNVKYTHQGWLTEDHNYLIFGDELDELRLGLKTTTYVLNVMDLLNPSLAGTYQGNTNAIDHNQYVKGNFVYQANYRAGLRIMEIDDISKAKFNEVGFFDIYPDGDEAFYNGAWSVYPFYESGKIIVSGIEQGLFVLKSTFITPAPSGVPSNKPTISSIPSVSLFPSKNPTMSFSPSKSINPTLKPSKLPSQYPSKVPSNFPTKNPTKTPTKYPTKKPTKTPTKYPTKTPTKSPTKYPTKTPTTHPTKTPTTNPTQAPTKHPTKTPTTNPTKTPTKYPTKTPTTNPTKTPTTHPTITSKDLVSNSLIIYPDENTLNRKVNGKLCANNIHCEPTFYVLSGNLFRVSSKNDLSIYEMASFVKKSRKKNKINVKIYTTEGRGKGLNTNKYREVINKKVTVHRPPSKIKDEYKQEYISFGKLKCPVNLQRDKTQAFLIMTTGNLLVTTNNNNNNNTRQNRDMEIINIFGFVKKKTNKGARPKNKRIIKKRGKIVKKNKFKRRKKLMWAGHLLYSHPLSTLNC